jgi:hypothetical protein
MDKSVDAKGANSVDRTGAATVRGVFGDLVVLPTLRRVPLAQREGHRGLSLAPCGGITARVLHVDLECCL